MLIVGLLFYILMIPIVGGITSYRMRFNNSSDDRTMGTIMAGLFWPVATMGLILFTIGRLMYRLMERIGSFIGHISNKQKIAASTIKMMEDDVLRSGGNMDIIIAYDYTACDICYGSGCHTCNMSGVVRKKVHS